MILKDKKIIYLHIPKCAGKSVEVFLCGEEYKNPHNRDWNTRNEIINGNYRDFFKFTIIRDPIERFLSVYNYLSTLWERSNKERDIYNAEIFSKSDINETAQNIDYYKDKLDTSKFMFETQYQWVFYNDEMLVDRVLLYDELPDNIIDIGKKFNIYNEFPHRNKSLGENKITNLDFKSINNLNHYYLKDFELIRKIREGKMNGQ